MERKIRPLEILGISEAEERAYSWLLDHSGATVPEAAQGLELSPGKTQRLFDAIETKGLATHSPERPRRYIPVSPDIALRTLKLKRQEELQQAEDAIRKLQKKAEEAQPHAEQPHMVELITSQGAGRQILQQMNRMAQQEVVALVRLPVMLLRLEEFQDYEPQREAQAKGVHFRSIVDAEFLTLPGAVHRTREDMKAGEEVRSTLHLPFKMVIIDQRIALIPLKLQQEGGPVLLVRSSALLDALYALFEILWERAAPISFTRAGTLETGDSVTRLPEGVEDLLSLMAAGLNDKKVAYELELSLRTLQRRIGELMKSLDAQTRFQLGWLAALRLSGAESKADRIP